MNKNNQLHQFKSVKNIDYFDSNSENVNNVFIITADKYIICKNVYIFVDRLKNLIKLFMIDIIKRVRKLVSFYFQKEAFI